MDYKTKMGCFYLTLFTGLIGAHWLLPTNRITLKKLLCLAAQRLPLQQTTGQHHLTHLTFPGSSLPPDWRALESTLKPYSPCPRRYTTQAEQTLLESLASVLFSTAALYVRQLELLPWKVVAKLLKHCYCFFLWVPSPYPP